jgi:bifunctional DNA-binding transcriptional regulator/antitoxin component of YhaV-PrlF toxin-antitoxin module
MKVVLNRGQYKITIPKELAEEKGWGPGTKVRFVEDLEGNIFLKVIELKPASKKISSIKTKTRKKT